MITMEQMTQAARDLVAAEEATAAAEDALKEKKEKERKLREETIPGMFAELGVERLKLADGSDFTCKQEVYASIPAGRRDEAYAWVESQGDGGIIKTEVQIPFGKGEMEQAMKLLDELASLGVTNAVIDRSIHPQTLKAYLKEKLNAEAESVDMEAEEPMDLEDRLEAALSPAKIDLELFGARPVMTATVKVPKPKIPKAKSYPGAGQVHEWNG